MADSRIYTKDPTTGVRTYMSPLDPMPVGGSVRKLAALATGTEYNGFMCLTVGTTAWTATAVDGGTVTFTPAAGQEFLWRVSSVDPGTGGGTGVGYPP